MCGDVTPQSTRQLRGAKLIERVTVPKASGASVIVASGDVLRVVATEGPQAVDLIAFNAHDYSESLCVWLTRQTSKSFAHAETFYTRFPKAREIFSLIDAPTGVFWLSPGRCNRFNAMHPDGKNCQDILAGCIERYGMSQTDVPDVLNIFMRPAFRVDGTYELLAADVPAGASVALHAKMNVLAAVSACPSHASFNPGGPRSVCLEVWSPAPPQTT